MNPEILSFLKSQGLMDDLKSITRHRYTKAEALLDTEYREEVLSYLETQLRNLESERVTEEDKINILGVSGFGRTFSSGFSYNDFGTIFVQRSLEIETLQRVIYKAKHVKRECAFHKRVSFSNAPFD